MNAIQMKAPQLATWGVGLICGVLLTLAVTATVGIPGYARSAQQVVRSQPAPIAPVAPVVQATQVVDQVAGMRDERVWESMGQNTTLDPIGGLKGGPEAVDTPAEYSQVNGVVPSVSVPANLAPSQPSDSDWGTSTVHGVVVP